MTKIVSELRQAELGSGGDLSWSEVRAHLSAKVKNKVIGKLRSKFDESDIVQQSLIEAQLGIHQFKGRSIAEFRNWLTSVIENNLIDLTRRFRQSACRSIDQESTYSSLKPNQLIDRTSLTASSILVHREMDVELVRIVESLSDSQQKLLEYRHKFGWTFARIGAELGISEQAARKRWNSIIEKLRKDLGSRGKT